MPEARGAAGAEHDERSTRSRIPAEIWILLAATFFVAIGFGLIVPVLPLFAKTFDVGATLVAFIVSAFAFFRLVFAPPAGILVNRFGERSMYVTGILIVAASTAATAFAGDYVQLLIFRSLGGVGSVLFSVSASGMLVRFSPPDIRGRVSAMWGGVFLIGNITGPAVGGVLGQFGMQLPFLVYATTLVIAAAIVGVFLRAGARAEAGRAAARARAGESVADDAEEGAARSAEPPASAPAPAPMRLRDALPDSAYRASLAFGFASGWVNFGLRSAVVPLLIAAVVSAEPWVSGTVLAVSAAANVVVLQWAGRASDRVGRRPLILAGLAVSLVGTVLFGFATNLPLALVGGILFGIGSGLSVPAEQAAIADIVGFGRRGGSVLSTYQMVQDGGAIVGPIVAGLIIDAAGYPLAFVVSAVTTLLALGMWLRGRETLPAR